MKTIPSDFPVRALRADEPATDRATCGTCGRSWDDAIATSYTPSPSGRCPFEYFHDAPRKRAPTLATPVSSQYGAPMGRHEYTRARGEYLQQWRGVVLPEFQQAYNALHGLPLQFRLEKIRLDSGGYDAGGAYWGIRRRGESLFFAKHESDEAEVFRTFSVASRADALAALREEFPKAYTFNEKRERQRVLFRMMNASHGGYVLALFPDLSWREGDRDEITSYAHVGQHGAASYFGVMRTSRPAKPEEYAALQRELEGAPYWYDLIVIKRR